MRLGGLVCTFVLTVLYSPNGRSHPRTPRVGNLPPPDQRTEPASGPPGSGRVPCVVTAKTQYNLKNALHSFQEHFPAGAFYDQRQRLPANGVDRARNDLA